MRFSSSSHLAKLSYSGIFVLMGDFNELGICWEGKTSLGRKSRRFLDYSGNNLLMQVLGRMTRGSALLINKEDSLREWLGLQCL